MTARKRRRSPLARVSAWWKALEAAERVLYRAVVLSAIGFGMLNLALAFIAPAVLFALVFFGFSFQRSR
jgi:hypothetical protein